MRTEDEGVEAGLGDDGVELSTTAPLFLTVGISYGHSLIIIQTRGGIAWIDNLQDPADVRQDKPRLPIADHDADVRVLLGTTEVQSGLGMRSILWEGSRF